MTRPSNGDKASISRRQALALLGSAPFLSLQSSCSSKESNNPPSQKSEPTEPLEYSSLRDVARRIQSKEISPVELTTRMLYSTLGEMACRFNKLRIVQCHQSLERSIGAIPTNTGKLAVGRVERLQHGI